MYIEVEVLEYEPSSNVPNGLVRCPIGRTNPDHVIWEATKICIGTYGS